MIESTLKPCPFCGGEYTQVRYMGGKWQEPSAFSSGYRGECCDCGTTTAAYDTEAEATAAWNARAERTCHIVEASRKYVLSDGTELYEDGCSECNGYLGDGDNYCPNCGRKVVDA